MAKGLSHDWADEIMRSFSEKQKRQAKHETLNKPVKLNVIDVLKETDSLRRLAVGAVCRAIETRKGIQVDTEREGNVIKYYPGQAGMRYLSAQLDIPLDEITLWEVQQGIPVEQVQRVKRLLKTNGFAEWSEYQIRPGKHLAEQWLKFEAERKREGTKYKR